MIQRGERVRTRTWAIRLPALARAKVALLADEVRVGSPELTRLGLTVLSLTCLTMVIWTPGHFRPTTTPLFAIQVVAGTLAALVSAFLSALPPRRVFSRRARQGICGLGLAGLVILPVLSIVVGGPNLPRLVNGAPYGNDGAMMDQYAAMQVLHGHNPYVSSSVVYSLALANAPSTTVTPLMDGQFRDARAYPSDAGIQQAFMNVLHYRPHTIPPEFESKYNYPSGAFLTVLPFVWAGLHDMRLLYLFALVLLLVYISRRTSRSLRVLVPLLFLANVPMVLNIAGGQPDPLYILFLVLGFAEWRRNRISPLLMGLAVATKQLAWFYAPFYAVVVWRQLGWREAVRRAGVMSAVFLVLNGPFIAQSPGSYLASIAAPMTDPMFPLGMGLVALFVSGVLPMLPKLAFTAAEAGAWLASVLGFARSRLPVAAGSALAPLALFFAWRSLDNYFYLVPFVVLAVALNEERFSTQRIEA